MTETAVALASGDMVRRLERQARALRVLSACNRALVQADDIDAFLHEVCRIAVEAGYRLVWVGRREGTDVVPIARAGRQEQDLAYVDGVRATTADEPRGRGPSGMAIRTGKPVVARRYETDSSFEPWREQALSRGYGSGLAVPLLQDGQAWGMAALYSDEPDAFDSEEVALLQDVGALLSFGSGVVRERAARRESEARFRALFESSIEGIVLHELVRNDDGQAIDYRILDANPAFDRHTGLPVDVIRGALASKVYGAGEAPHLEWYKRVVETGEPCRFEASFAPLGRAFRITAFRNGVDGFATVFEDITERQHAAQALKLSEARLSALHELGQREFESEREVIDFALDRAVDLTGSEIGYFHFVESDQVNLSLFAWSKTALERCTAGTDRHYPLSEAGIWADCIRLKQPVVHNDYASEPGRKGLPAGHAPVVRHMSACVLDQGKVVVVAGVGNKKTDYQDDDVRQLQLFLEGVWNVIARRRDRAAVEASSELWSATFDAIPEMVSVVSGEHRFVQINEAGCRMLKRSRSEIIGRKCFELMHGTDAPLPGCPCSRSIATGGAETFVLEQGGRTYETSAWPLRGGGGESGFVHAIKDVTEERKREAERAQLEEQLRASHRLEAVGSLAGGIAHDFNNLLSVVLNNAQFALDQLRPEDPIREDIMEVVKSGWRAALLTKQLLAFSRKQVLKPEVLSVNDVVTAMEGMLRRLIREDIELVWRLAPDLPLIEADPGQLQQVVMNIVVNARDAMPGGGTLTVETSSVELDDEYAAHVSAQPGPYVMVVFSDTGEGMDAQTKARMFEPFFTTKAVGKGTGLGLSTVYGIVKQSGGAIWVYSEPGKGTSFKLYFPLAREARVSLRPSDRSDSLPGTETVLVVEDEPGVRRIAERVLSRAGYLVLTAANGAEALRVREQHPGAVHLLLTDVVMPGMSGRELAERLSQGCPQMKVLYMSGYTDDAIVHHGVLDAGTEFIAKPFNGVDLERKVREVLDGPELEAPV